MNLMLKMKMLKITKGCWPGKKYKNWWGKSGLLTQIEY